MSSTESLPALPHSEYERFADIYGIWTATAGSTHKNKPFYVDAYLAADGPVVELGVGDGRIAVDAAAARTRHHRRRPVTHDARSVPGACRTGRRRSTA